MPAKHVIEVPLPEGVEPTTDERELLEGAFRVVLSLRYGSCPEGEETVRRLVERGWTVRARPGWIVEARRAGEVEKTSGRTRCEALADLESLARLDDMMTVA